MEAANWRKVAAGVLEPLQEDRNRKATEQTKTYLLICNLKNTGFREAAACNLVEMYRRFRITYCLHDQGRGVSQASSKQSILTACFLGILSGPEDGGNTFLRNVGKLLPDYMASHPRRQSPP
jgi:hypothetical protein